MCLFDHSFAFPLFCKLNGIYTCIKHLKNVHSYGTHVYLTIYMYYFLNATVESSLIFVLIFLFAKVKTVQDKNDSKRKMKRRKNGKITNGTDEEKTDVTETEEKDIPTERGSSFKITIQN